MARGFSFKFNCFSHHRLIILLLLLLLLYIARASLPRLDYDTQRATLCAFSVESTMVKEEPLTVEDLETTDEVEDSSAVTPRPPVTNKPPPPPPVTAVNNNKGSRFAKPTSKGVNKPVALGVFDRLTTGDRLNRPATKVPNNKILTVKSAAGVPPAPSTVANNIKRNSVISNPSSTDAAPPPPPPAALPPVTELVSASVVLDVTDNGSNYQSSINGDAIDQPHTDTISNDAIVIKKSMPSSPTVTKMVVVSHHRKSWIERIPGSLVERMSLARAALPILPTGFAWFCFLLNFLLPGSGTATSGLLACCMGAPRFATIVTAEHRVLALIINLGVGVFQFLSVIFCLVGWCWSVAWGIILVKTAGFYKSKTSDARVNESLLEPAAPNRF